MTEPLSSEQYHVDQGEPTTPTYDEQTYLANIGRCCVVWAGFAVSQRPPAAIVRRALRRQGLLTEKEID